MFSKGDDKSEKIFKNLNKKGLANLATLVVGAVVVGALTVATTTYFGNETRDISKEGVDKTTNNVTQHAQEAANGDILLASQNWEETTPSEPGGTPVDPSTCLHPNLKAVEGGNQCVDCGSFFAETEECIVYINRNYTMYFPQYSYIIKAVFNVDENYNIKYISTYYNGKKETMIIPNDYVSVSNNTITIQTEDGVITATISNNKENIIFTMPEVGNLTLSLEKEYSKCSHENSELLYQSIAYTGDLYCYDCGTTLQTGSEIENAILFKFEKEYSAGIDAFVFHTNGSLDYYYNGDNTDWAWYTIDSENEIHVFKYSNPEYSYRFVADKNNPNTIQYIGHSNYITEYTLK